LNSDLSFLAYCRFAALVQRKSNIGKIQNKFITPDKVLNALMYESIHFDVIQYFAEHVNWP